MPVACARRVAVPAVRRNARIGAARQQFERASHQVVARGKQHVTLGDRERECPLRIFLAAPVERNAAGLPLLELLAERPERALHHRGIGGPADVQEFDIAKPVQRERGFGPGEFTDALEVGQKIGGFAVLVVHFRQFLE